MKNIVVIYWSGTGNTEAMAHELVQGASIDGVTVSLLNVNTASIEDIKNDDAVALGCPSMGAEQLEESEMEPFIESITEAIRGKKLVLFGSYGWGSGEWMRDWEEKMRSYGANLLKDGLIINSFPDEEGLELCRKLGEVLAKD